MTRVLQPQRDIDREKEGGEREKERGIERKHGEKVNVSNKSAQEARYHDAANVWHVLSHFTMVIPTHIAEKARHHHSVDVKKRDAFIQRRFYTQQLLHTDTFTQRRFYTQKLLHTEGFTHRH